MLKVELHSRTGKWIGDAMIPPVDRLPHVITWNGRAFIHDGHAVLTDERPDGASDPEPPRGVFVESVVTEASLALNLQPGFERCHAGRAGDCDWRDCPQIRDGEPHLTGRPCPLEDAATEPAAPTSDECDACGDSLLDGAYLHSRCHPSAAAHVFLQHNTLRVECAECRRPVVLFDVHGFTDLPDAPAELPS